MTEQEYVEEYIRIFDSLMKDVYLRSLTAAERDFLAQEGATNYDLTNLSPLDVVIWLGDPDKITNQIERGQKARMKRYRKWLKENKTC